MRFSLAITLFAVLLALALAVLKVGEAAAGRRTPLTGSWSATFSLDSLQPPSGDDDRGVRSAARQAVGVVSLDLDNPEWPFWTVGFRGTHSVDFAPLYGRNGREAPEAIGFRFDADSVYLGLSTGCCGSHTGGVWGRGRILGDSVVGTWETDSDGWGAWGRFIMHRSELAMPSDSMTRR